MANSSKYYIALKAAVLGDDASYLKSLLGLGNSGHSSLAHGDISDLLEVAAYKNSTAAISELLNHVDYTQDMNDFWLAVKGLAADKNGGAAMGCLLKAAAPLGQDKLNFKISDILSTALHTGNKETLEALCGFIETIMPLQKIDLHNGDDYLAAALMAGDQMRVARILPELKKSSVEFGLLSFIQAAAKADRHKIDITPVIKEIENRGWPYDIDNVIRMAAECGSFSYLTELLELADRIDHRINFDWLYQRIEQSDTVIHIRRTAGQSIQSFTEEIAEKLSGQEISAECKAARPIEESIEASLEQAEIKQQKKELDGIPLYDDRNAPIPTYADMHLAKKACLDFDVTQKPRGHHVHIVPIPPKTAAAMRELLKRNGIANYRLHSTDLEIKPADLEALQASLKERGLSNPH